MATVPTSSQAGPLHPLLPPSNNTTANPTHSSYIDETTPLLPPSPAPPSSLTPSHSIKITSIIRLLALLLSLHPLVYFIFTLGFYSSPTCTGSCPPQWRDITNKPVRIAMIVASGLLILRNVGVLVWSGWVGLGGGRIRGRVLGAALDLSVCCGVVGVTVWGVLAFHDWSEEWDEMDLCWIVGALQFLVALISAWPRISDSRLAWVRLIYESDEETISEPDNLLDVEHSSSLINEDYSVLTIEPPFPHTQPSNNPSTTTKTYALTPFSILLRTFTIPISIPLYVLADPHSYYGSPPQKALLISICFNILIIIVYLRSKHTPKPSHLLKFVLKKEDIEEARRVRGGFPFGGEGPFLTERGVRTLGKGVWICDLVIGVGVAWGFWELVNWRGWELEIVTLEVILMFLLFMIASHDILWKKVVTVYMTVRSRTATPAVATESGPIPPEQQVYRDVESEAGVEGEDSERE